MGSERMVVRHDADKRQFREPLGHEILILDPGGGYSNVDLTCEHLLDQPA